MTPKQFYLPKEKEEIFILHPPPKFSLGDRVYVTRVNVWGKITKVFENAVAENGFIYGIHYGIDIEGGHRTTAPEWMISQDVLGQVADL